jgi:hypothetical protein
VAVHADETHVSGARANTGRLEDEVNRITRNTHTGFDLRTHWHPVHVRCELRHQRGLELVTAVMADLIAEQATRDADARSIAIVTHASIVRTVITLEGNDLRR